MPNRFAVIDLGTNTFHLLVAEYQASSKILKELHRARFFVKLAEEGIETIGQNALDRGFHALESFRKDLDVLGIKEVKAIGTAALRTASNGLDFIKLVKDDLDIQIELIDGNREAELIYKGVVLAVPFQDQEYLIMDIGGGSVEFIIANKIQILWARSFPIGVAVLFHKFHRTEPIHATAVAALNDFLNQILQPLFETLKQFPCVSLIGASGTFDVMENLLADERKYEHHAYIEVPKFYPLYECLLQSTKAERFAMNDIPDKRADMIVVAFILIHFLLKNTNISEIITSNYAMKEGILSELMAA